MHNQWSEITALLRQWRRSGTLAPVDEALALFLYRHDPSASPLLYLLSALLSRHSANGHIGLEIDTLPATGHDLFPRTFDIAETPQNHISPGEFLENCAPEELLAALRHPIATRDMGSAPLVCVAENPTVLYLRRLYNAQEGLRRHLQDMLALTAPEENGFPAIHTVRNSLFPKDRPLQDRQMIASLLPLLHRLTIITGGPGTGKTTTIQKLIAVANAAGYQRIMVAAPTGKAANRLEETFRGAVETVPEAVRRALPERVQTIHRLLGISPHHSRRRYTTTNPLPVDLLVIDEASMVNLELMERVLEALPAHGRLVLVGDPDQLAAVEAGAVLADLCNGVTERGYSRETIAQLVSLSGDETISDFLNPASTPLAQTQIELQESFRFHKESAFGMLAAAIRQGDEERVIELLADQHSDLRCIPRQEPFHDQIKNVAARGYADYLSALSSSREPEVVLAALERYRVLTPLRRGLEGSVEINRVMDRAIGGGRLWYHGRPFVVTRNDYYTGLMNGDTGIVLRENGELYAYVATGDDSVMKQFALVQLPPVESAWALTIHKAQGSEFDEVLLVVPQQISPVLSRELMYTGITRARSQVTILEGSRITLLKAIQRRVIRQGGLARGW
jgi:exodeoxyribonuclease V alpha subunit